MMLVLSVRSERPSRLQEMTHRVQRALLARIKPQLASHHALSVLRASTVLLPDLRLSQAVKRYP